MSFEVLFSCLKIHQSGITGRSVPAPACTTRLSGVCSANSAAVTLSVFMITADEEVVCYLDPTHDATTESVAAVADNKTN